MAKRAKLTVNNLDVVLEELYGVRTHWYNMGLKLKLKANTLDAIKSKCSGDPSECFREILKRYLQRVTPLPSWRSLVEALRSPIVDQPQLAEEVERRYCQALKLHETEDTCLLQSPHQKHNDIPLQGILTPPVSPGPTESEDSQPSVAQKHCDSSPHTEEISTPPSLVSENRPETPAEDELHRLAMQISTNSEVSTDEEQQPKDFGCGCGECTFHSFLEKGCPKPILSMSSFPYLNTEGLNHSQKQILRGKLYHEFEEISGEFGILFQGTCESLIQQGVTVQRLVLFLRTLDAFQPTLPRRPLLEEHIEELKTADSIYDVFHVLHDYTSFFSYHIIECIIRKFGTPKDKECLQDYTNKLEIYSRRSVFECPTYSVRRKDQADLVVKLEGVNLEKYTPKHLEVFQFRISNIIKVSKYTLRLVTVQEGCLQLTFQMPHFVKEEIFLLSDSQKAALQDEGVTHLTCDDHHYPLELIRTFDDKVQSMRENAAIKITRGESVEEVEESPVVKQAPVFADFISSPSDSKLKKQLPIAPRRRSKSMDDSFLSTMSAICLDSAEYHPDKQSQSLPNLMSLHDEQSHDIEEIEKQWDKQSIRSAPATMQEEKETLISQLGELARKETALRGELSRQVLNTTLQQNRSLENSILKEETNDLVPGTQHMVTEDSKETEDTCLLHLPHQKHNDIPPQEILTPPVSPESEDSQPSQPSLAQKHCDSSPHTEEIPTPPSLGILPDRMQIFVKTINDKTITIDVGPSDTVKTIKSKIQDKEGLPADAFEQHLMFGGHQLNDDHFLMEYSVQRASTIFLSLSFKPIDHPDSEEDTSDAENSNMQLLEGREAIDVLEDSDVDEYELHKQDSIYEMEQLFVPEPSPTLRRTVESTEKVEVVQPKPHFGGRDSGYVSLTPSPQQIDVAAETAQLLNLAPAHTF